MAGAVTTKTELDFEMAFKHAKWIVENGDGKRKSYLTANFDITQKEKEQVSAPDLVKVVAKAFSTSQDPRKLERATGIFTQLAAMAPTSTAPALVKQFLPVLERARLKEIPRQLSMLLQAKEIIKEMYAYVECSFPCIRGDVFSKQHYTRIGTTQFFKVKNQASREEYLQLLQTTEGLALSHKFPMLFNGEGCFNADAVHPDDHKFLRTFIDRSHGVCSPLAAKFYWYVESNLANRNFNAMNKRFSALPTSLACMMSLKDTRGIQGQPKEPNPYFEPGAQAFYEKAYLPFHTLFRFYSDNGQELANDDFSSPRFYRFITTFFDRCKRVDSTMGELNAAYRALYEEFDTLNRKYASADAPLPALPPSCFPSIHRRDLFPALPTPEQYASILCSLPAIDFSTSYPPLPPFKPTPKPASVLVDSSRVAKTEEKAVRQDSKEEEPRKSSIFEGRTFTFSQKDQRVLDWETNPEKQLAADTYSSLPSHLQKEQTWRHGCSVLDPFVGTEYSRKGEWTNNRGEKQTAYFIQAEVECQGKTTRCVFQYAFDKDNVLYHRYAGERSNIQIVDDLMAKNRYECDFPTLDKSFELFKAKPSSVKVDVPGETLYTIDPLDVITVKDPKYDLIIRIFRQG